MVHSTFTTRGKSPLAQWFHETVALDDLRVRFQLRGHNLYIYCEADELPGQLELLGRLLPALQAVDLNTLVPANQPEIEQVFLYGKQVGHRRSQWSSPITLSQLEQHLEQWQQMQAVALESALAEYEGAASGGDLNQMAWEESEAIAQPSDEPATPADAKLRNTPLVSAESVDEMESEPSELPDRSDSVVFKEIHQGAGAIAESPILDAEPIPQPPINLTDVGWHTDFMQPPIDALNALEVVEASENEDSSSASNVLGELPAAEPLDAPTLEDIEAATEGGELTERIAVETEAAEEVGEAAIAEPSEEAIAPSHEITETEAAIAEAETAEETPDLMAEDSQEFSDTSETEDQPAESSIEAPEPPAAPTLLLDDDEEPDESGADTPADFSSKEPEAVEEPELEPVASVAAPAETQEAAIARQLTQALSAHGLLVRAKIQDARSAATPDRPQRLWVQCEATYSPEPSALAEAIAAQIRSLNLEGFRDAVVVMQVRGEPTPDWMLRVDLTPPTEMLRDWARWGDVQAIAHLLDRALQPEQMSLTAASLQESTLHLTCGRGETANENAEGSGSSTSPDQERVRAIAEPLLNDLSPQGIDTAMVYGHAPGGDAPDWFLCLDLPAKTQAERSASTMERAREGSLRAIAFLLTRLLNPNLEQQLATGGVRVQVVSKPEEMGQSVLHIMTDAPVCPDPEVVSPAIERFLRDLQMPRLAGVRVYGRRAGQKKPIWGKRADFLTRPRLVPEAPPEFAASEAYVSELIAPTDEEVYRPEVTTEDVRSAWQQTRDRFASGARNLLLRSHLFVPAVASGVSEPPKLTGTQSKQGWALAMVWGAAGLLLTIQADLGLSRWLRPEPEQSASLAQMEEVPGDEGEAIADEPTEDEAGDPDGFISFDEEAGEDDAELVASSDLPYTQDTVQEQLITAEILAGESPYPTFNVAQLDEKLLLYYERMREQAAASDVLIVGSSRALRGIDPVALEQELAELGYEDVTIFNFGVNGATAKVVEFILGHLLEPAQLPKLVIWADGARAFNSSTVDVTYNGIAVSPGYRDWQRGELERPDLSEILETEAEVEEVEDAPTGINASLTASYEAIDRTLSETLGNASNAFELRDRLKTQIQETVASLVPSEAFTPAEAVSLNDAGSLPPESLQSLSEQGREMVDFDGFLPIALQFNPATYYQEFARVAGRYDSDYENFRLTGSQTDALHDLLTTMGDREIPVVFVNLPLTDEYLDSDRQAYEQEFRQFMLEIASEYPNFYFRDLSEVWTTEYDYFSDPSHLNRYGAYEIARRLAQDPMIPWSDLREQTADSTTTAQNISTER